MIRNTAVAVFVVLFAAMLFGCGSNNGGPTGPNGPETGTITFYSESEHFSLMIWVDSTEVGTTPCSYTNDVSEEEHTLDMQIVGVGDTVTNIGTFKIKGSTDVTISPGEVCLANGDVRAEDGSPLSGVKVDVMALDEVTVIGSVLTQANGAFELYILKNFTSALRFSKDEYETLTILIEDISETGMDIRLAKILPTILTLQVTPISAEPEIWIDGDSLGSADVSGYFETAIEPGNHELKLIGWGCKEWTSTISISAGETKSQNISFEVWNLAGTWKRESDDKEVDVTLTNVNELRGLNPVGRFYVKGNRLTYTDPFGSDAHAEGVILKHGERIEFTFHSQYGSTTYVYEKIS